MELRIANAFTYLPLRLLKKLARKNYRATFLDNPLFSQAKLDLWAKQFYDPGSFQKPQQFHRLIGNVCFVTLVIDASIVCEGGEIRTHNKDFSLTEGLSLSHVPFCYSLTNNTNWRAITNNKPLPKH